MGLNHCNILRNWLLGQLRIKELSNIQSLRTALMPMHLSAEDSANLFSLYISILKTSVEGVTLLNSKDKYNSYSTDIKENSSVNGKLLQQISDNIVSSSYLVEEPGSTFIDNIYNALIYILGKL